MYCCHDFLFVVRIIVGSVRCLESTLIILGLIAFGLPGDSALAFVFVESGLQILDPQYEKTKQE